MKRILTGLVLAVGMAQAATLPYQGLATDAKGKPLADGNYIVVFGLYTNALGASPVWTEAQSATTAKGLFSTFLGAVNPIPDSLFDGTALYLGVRFNGGPESGRSPLGTTPWATRSGKAGSARFADSSGKVAGLTDSVSALRAGLDRLSSTVSAKDSVGKAHLADSAKVAIHLSGPDSSLLRSTHDSLVRLAAQVQADSMGLRTARDSIRLLNRLLFNQGNTLSGLIGLVYPEIAWKASVAYGNIVDSRDGQVYRTVVIGSQTWLAQNLNFPGVSGDVIGSCPGNDPANCAKYGRTYTFPQAFNLSDSCMARSCAASISVKHQGVCPVGWHIPDTAEWRKLSKFLDPATSSNMYDVISSTAGGKLKALGGWTTPGTDDFGFRALPAGGYGGGPGRDAMWWVSWEVGPGYGYRTQVDNTNSLSLWNVMKMRDSPLPVRCLKD